MPRVKKEEITEQISTKPRTKVKSGFIAGTGRRKTATARVFLWEEKGEFTINGMDISEYFATEQEQTQWLKPFHLIGVSHPKAKFTASIKVQGSGKSAQLGAVVHGISAALAGMNEEFRSILAKQGLLTRDPRMVERKKYFLHKARKRPQYSKR
ncbi:30S ribosomal protein S9 [candidate division WWE3 bacterium]|jgi:small subunit ribosomal protein S9|uniref:Small ribosomal subunit protein uS9 n=1 Tax=candidate division WWE3 bacterium TaxID=2053526 RepID=A0A3A4ZE44_UNCKA|nr:MAG: 30S ribosomal protein S9 [candidate division WWE3 bacterium]